MIPGDNYNIKTIILMMIKFLNMSEFLKLICYKDHLKIRVHEKFLRKNYFP